MRFSKGWIEEFKDFVAIWERKIDCISKNYVIQISCSILHSDFKLSTQIFILLSVYSDTVIQC